MGKFVYLACPTNPLNGPELSLGPVVNIVTIFSFICLNSKKENRKIQHQRYQ